MKDSKEWHRHLKNAPFRLTWSKTIVLIIYKVHKFNKEYKIVLIYLQKIRGLNIILLYCFLEPRKKRAINVYKIHLRH